MTLLTASILDRAKGCLVGLAVGDALGTTLEFSERDSLPPVVDMIGGGPFSLKPGQWTDDTSMALCLADSLLHKSGFDPADMMDRFADWMKKGSNSCTGKCFDIGITTRKAISNYLNDASLQGASNSYSAGNGSIMRLAPSVLFALDDAAKAVDTAVRQSVPTHAAPEVLEACALMASILHGTITGQAGRRLALEEVKILEITEQAYLAKERHEIRSSGYVVHTLEAALWALAKTDNFRDAVLTAVNLGDDADTVGAVAGQLAGAKYGYNAIPSEWLATLAWQDKIAKTAVSLASVSLNKSLRPGGELTPRPPMA